jgi:hypothetical protein
MFAVHSVLLASSLALASASSSSFSSLPSLGAARRRAGADALLGAVLLSHPALAAALAVAGEEAELDSEEEEAWEEDVWEERGDGHEGGYDDDHGAYDDEEGGGGGGAGCTGGGGGSTSKAPAGAVSESLYRWLRGLRMEDKARALAAYGVKTVPAVLLLNADDLRELEFSTIEARRFRRAQVMLGRRGGALGHAEDRAALAEAHVEAAGTAEQLEDLKKQMDRMPESYHGMSMEALLADAARQAPDDLELQKELAETQKMLQKLEITGMTVDDMMQIANGHASGEISAEELLRRLAPRREAVDMMGPQKAEL